MAPAPLVFSLPHLLSASQFTSVLLQRLLASEKGAHKFCPVKNLQVLDLFTQPDIFHGDIQFVGDADHDTAFSSAIQLGKNQSGYISDFRKSFRLFQIERAHVETPVTWPSRIPL